MRSFFITVAVATLGLALGACQNKRQPEPVPPPQSKHAVIAKHDDPAAAVSEISWFQGTLDEAFSRGPCPSHRRPLLRF